jgi:hypothetical protein
MRCWDACFRLVVSSAMASSLWNVVAAQCPAGEFLFSNSCISCPSGTFSAKRASNCTACAGNLNSPVGSSSCSSSYPMYMIVAARKNLRRIDLTSSAVSTLPFTSDINSFDAVTMGPGFALVTEHLCVSKWVYAGTQMNVIAGSCAVYGSGTSDGIGTNARFSGHFDIKLSKDMSFALIPDTNSHSIRKIVLSNNAVSSLPLLLSFRGTE